MACSSAGKVTGCPSRRSSPVARTLTFRVLVGFTGLSSPSLPPSPASLAKKPNAIPIPPATPQRTAPCHQTATASDGYLTVEASVTGTSAKGENEMGRPSHLQREGVNPTVAGHKEAAVGSQDRNKVAKTRHHIPRTSAHEDGFAAIAAKAMQSVVALGAGHPLIHTTPWRSSAIAGTGS